MAVYAILELKLNPDTLDKAREAMHTTLEQTRARPGNEAVDVFFDTADETHVFIYEKWTTAEDDAAYRAWRLTPEGASALRTVVAGPPTVTMLELAADV